MTIAIDIDGTWTRDPQFWRSFVESAQESGHTVIIATARRAGDTDDFSRFSFPIIPVIFSSGNFKRQACERAGFKVDVWIDDCPSMIDGGLLINNDKEDL